MSQPERVTTEQIKRYQNKIDAADTPYQKKAAVTDVYHDLYEKGYGDAGWVGCGGKVGWQRYLTVHQKTH